jgi:hypothetical protein
MLLNDGASEEHRAAKFKINKPNIKRVLAFCNALSEDGTDFALFFKHHPAIQTAAQLRKATDADSSTEYKAQGHHRGGCTVCFHGSRHSGILLLHAAA